MWGKPTLKDSMTRKLVTIPQMSSLEAARSLMDSHEIHHLVVTDAEGDIVGLISDRDLQRALKSTLRRMGDLQVEDIEFDPQAMVKDYMTWPVMAVDIGESLKSIVNAMLKEKVSVFVVERRGVAVGIVTTHDMLKVLAKMLEDDADNARVTLDDWLANPRFLSSANTLGQAGF